MGLSGPECRQIATAAECNTVSHKRDADSAAEFAMTDVGRISLGNEVVRLAHTVSERLLVWVAAVDVGRDA